MGIDGEPSVSSYAQTYATLNEMLNRADKRGQTLHFVVGDSCGLENAALGRTTMEIIRDTGQMHGALLAGLEFAKQKAQASGDTAKVAQIDQSLAKIKAAEEKGIFFGSKDDTVSTKADLDQAQALAKPFVELRDFDVNGFTPVKPDPNVVMDGNWGTKDFQMAKDWVSACVLSTKAPRSAATKSKTCCRRSVARLASPRSSRVALASSICSTRSWAATIPR
jgi:hypothetical protein